MSAESHESWARLILAFLHDPPDKALDVRGHAARALRYAEVALGRPVTPRDMRAAAGDADRVAAVAERLPMPTAGRRGERAVAPLSGTLHIRHPVSGEAGTLRVGSLDEERVRHVIEDIAARLDTPKQRCLALWRLLPERLEAAHGGPWITRLPAESRAPDHSLFTHADITAGLSASFRDGGRGALLSLTFGPVQSFIEASRSVRDLWTGSAILSWLAFEALRPILATLGPTALVYPALRRNPLMDRWLRAECGLGDRIPEPDEDALRSPCLPNRFVAVVPESEAAALAERCEESLRISWGRLTGEVREQCDGVLRRLDADWDRLWNSQVGSLLEVRTTVVPRLADRRLAELIGGAGRDFAGVWPDADAVRGLADAIPASHRYGFSQDGAGRWQAQLEYSARVMETNRAVRHVPPGPGRRDLHEASPPKCSLFGSWEQMGPVDFRDSRSFWRAAQDRLRLQGVRLRSGERLSAVALAKRFAAPAFLTDELGLRPDSLRFPDTATVAAAVWLNDAGIRPDEIRGRDGVWSGRWLHGADPDEVAPPAEVIRQISAAKKQHGPPPAYYAILRLDGDDLGEWLGGSRSPRVREVLDPRLLSYYESLDHAGIAKGLGTRRPLGPALHSSISAALGKFAARIAPRIIRSHHGTVIYSGGDDLLALLPAREAVACAARLRTAYRSDKEHGEAPAMGSRATISGGIVFVHHMDDLRAALRAARDAEKRAKHYGTAQRKEKDALHLHFMRRSGERAGATMEWRRTDWFTRLTALFADGATDRWAYRLRQELPVLKGRLPPAAVESEVRRLAGRIQDPSWSAFAQESGESVPELIGDWWRELRDEWREPRPSEAARSPSALEAFTRLCQGASFVARGRDG